MLDSEFEKILHQNTIEILEEEPESEMFLPMSRYIDLIHNSRLLATLHAFGVSEWKHYDECVKLTLLEADPGEEPIDEEIQ